MEEDCPDTVGHACNACRRRKLRCSKELPSCQHCRKSASECLYEPKRGKPGMKTGALENIHRRLDALEHTVGRQQATLDGLEGEGEQGSRDYDSTVHTILSSLATSLQSLNRRQSSLTRPCSRNQNQDQERSSTAKRRRTEEDGQRCQSFPTDHVAEIPEDLVLGDVLEAYFTYVHPWTPIIHEGRLRRRLDEDVDRDKLSLVIQAMILVASRYIEDAETAALLCKSPKQSEDLRDWLVSKAMKQPSVENLQALVIIATDDIGSGQAPHAWPLVGSLSRMVEYLQLTVEHDEAAQSSFSQPYRLLAPPQDWIEAEERRRVFWSIFALDRFCSVSMGWNTSLTSDDVHRRLPCDGITWRKGNAVATPYFGIWDKSAGRIGNPIAFLPAHPVSAARPTGDDEGDAPPSEAGTSPGAASAAVDMSTVGAFAYCLEATESMSRVTSYFLQQKVNLNDQREFAAWLTRFKELDIRLVHWKMLLPKKWAVNVVQQASSRMDPNLTLAHVTHNASMILLHQLIAFPLPEWPFKSRLPSTCSVDTCQTAAIEVASITNQFLKHSPSTSPLSSQFAFCVFIAARAVLLSWQHSPPLGSSSSSAVAAEFWILIRNLDAMSARWAGVHGPESESSCPNLAAKYSSTLNQMHRRCSQEPPSSFTINISGYTTEIMHSTTSEARSPSSGTAASRPGDRRQSAAIQLADADARAALQFPPSQGVSSMTPNAAFSLNVAAAAHGLDPPNGVANLLRPELYNREAEDGDDPMAITQMLLDQQFTDLDRVISYSDGLFGSEFESQRW
ncbi:hypothetical protein FE257_009565 [Aspergillus nanangensis]|uniref:Zn(2)-C6 fungal-type domain-containing protein n=1 Tax=Aspergillus nanangensis TaxID=2582783 RepID=A0AAD4GRU2_ASPNN|nr:hypothetical protein FE257_009565 [Aspergillus nanangensis]